MLYSSPFSDGSRRHGSVAADLSIDFATPRTALRRLGRKSNAPLPADRALFGADQKLNNIDYNSPLQQPGKRSKPAPTVAPLSCFGDVMFLSSGILSPQPLNIEIAMATPIINITKYTGSSSVPQQTTTENSTARTNVSSVANNSGMLASKTPTMRNVLSQSPLTSSCIRGVNYHSPTSMATRCNDRYTSLGVRVANHAADVFQLLSPQPQRAIEREFKTPLGTASNNSCLHMSIEREEDCDESDSSTPRVVIKMAPSSPHPPMICVPTSTRSSTTYTVTSPDGVVQSPPAPRLQRFQVRPPPMGPRPPSAGCDGEGTFVRTFVPRPPPPRNN